MVILSFICIIVHIFFLPRGPNLLAFFLDIDLDIVSSAESYWELFVHLLFPFKIKKLISKLKILNLFAISLVEKFWKVKLTHDKHIEINSTVEFKS